MKRTLVTSMILALAASGYAADNESSSATAFPKSLTGLEVTYSRSQKFDTKVVTDYINIVYNNRSEYERGTAIRPKKPDVSNDVKIANANPGFLLQFLNGSGASSGSYFKTAAITPFKFKTNMPRDLHIAFDFGVGTGDTKPTDVAIGVQTLPFAALTKLGLGSVANWVVVGISGSSHWEDKMAAKNGAEAVFRAYASHAIWREDLDAPHPDIAGWAHKNVPTWKLAVEKFNTKQPAEEDVKDPKVDAYLEATIWKHFNNHLSIKANGSLIQNPEDVRRARLRLSLGETATVKDEELLTDEQWRKECEAADAGVREAFKFIPAYLVYGEAQGAYTLTKDVVGRRYNSLWAIGMKYNLARSKQYQALQLDFRYEHGFTLADRAKGTDSLLVGVIVKF